MLRILCPSCEKVLTVDPARAGMVGKCGACGGKFRVPEAPKVAPTAARPRPSMPSERESLREQQPATRSRSAAPRRPSPSPEPELDLELIEEEPQPARSRPQPRPRPVAPPEQELELVEDEQRPSARRTPSSSARSRPVAPPEDIDEVEPVEEERDDPLPRKRKKRKRRRTESDDEPSVYMPALIAFAICFGFWLVFTIAGLFLKPFAMVLLMFGVPAAVISRIWFRYKASQEGPLERLLCIFVPFYPTYMFFKNPMELRWPYVAGCAGVLFVFSGAALLELHNLRDLPGKGNGIAALVGNLKKHAGQNAANDDAECERLLAGPNAEAREWLRQPRNGGDQFTKMSATHFVDTAYQAGATRVIAAAFVVQQDGTTEAKFIVQLPVEKQARARVFRWFEEEVGEDAADTGQKYLLVDFFGD